jgi:peroxiredoxin
MTTDAPPRLAEDSESEAIVTSRSRLLGPGDPAPDFVLPAVEGPGEVRLSDYRGRTPLLLALFRGLHCPFCRRRLAHLAGTRDRLKQMGVETLAVVNTPLERARLYFAHRPTRVPLAADPAASTHLAFGLPAFDFVEDPAAAQWPVRATRQQFEANLIDPTGELASPRNGFEANAALNAKDGFELTDADRAIMAAHGTQLTGHFLIDRLGVIRWVHAEAFARMADIGRFPSDEEILEAARSMAG